MREGEKKNTTTITKSTSLLDDSKNWEMHVDLKKKLVFPDVVQTNLPSGYSSRVTRGEVNIIIELTHLCQLSLSADIIRY